MKNSFQAKEIQKILNIPKPRYEYVANKIGIHPEVQEVEGQGKAHIYSFKNLLEFAFTHNAVDLGLSPKAAMNLLIAINRFDEKMKQGIFDPAKTINIRAYYVKYHENNRTYYFGYKASPDAKELKYLLIESMTKLTPFEKIKKIAAMPPIKEILERALAYTSINLGTIKQNVLEKISG